jgi:murein L,D-transpeptidase YafK
VKHRKWKQVLTLTAACAVSLSAAAYLSYQAATLRESELAAVAGSDSAPLAIAAEEQPAAVAQNVAQGPVSAGETARPYATSEDPSSALVKVSLPASQEPLVAHATAVAPLGLRGGEAPREAAPADAAATVQPDRIASLEIVPTPDFELKPGKSVPLPPRRPVGLSAAVAPVDSTAVPPLAETPAAAVSPPPAALAAVAAAPQPAAVPAPVAVAPQPASRPVAAVIPQAGPAPQGQAAQLGQAAQQGPAASAAPDAFPGIASALAAVTASVGGAATPLPPGEISPVSPAVGGGFKKGSPVYVRIFKQEGTLELWIKRGENYALYKSFPVCKWSGQLGPKTRTADYQSPEGFYSVSARQLNPHSAYHLAFDVGYPNAFDRRQGSTGSAVMVHGDCKSIGCFAMTNDGIDEIYGLVAAALEGGQHEVPVHIFPFRMTESAIARESAPKTGNVLAFLSPGDTAPRRDWSPFWRNLKQGYDLFERSHVPPVAFACGDRYEFGASGRSCARIAGW